MKISPISIQNFSKIRFQNTPFVKSGLPYGAISFGGNLPADTFERESSPKYIHQKIKGAKDNFEGKRYVTTLFKECEFEEYDIKDIKALLDIINIGKAEDINNTASFLYDTLQLVDDAKDFTNYAKSIDFKKLSKTIPYINTFSPEQYLEFLLYHYENNKTVDFTKEDLSVEGDFTKFLQNKYVSADKLTEILTRYPATSREIGKIPDEWFENLSKDKKEQAKKEIYDAVSEFQKTKSQDDLQEKFSQILLKDTSIAEQGRGKYGTVYRIEIDNCDDVCLKIFDQPGLPYKHRRHGEHIEPQAALFVNKHSNDYVKMHFGRVSPNNLNDGFLVTQYLDYNKNPQECENVDLDSCEIIYYDSEHNNKIGNKIIDFGNIEVIEFEN